MRVALYLALGAVLGVSVGMVLCAYLINASETFRGSILPTAGTIDDQLGSISGAIQGHHTVKTSFFKVSHELMGSLQVTNIEAKITDLTNEEMVFTIHGEDISSTVEGLGYLWAAYLEQLEFEE